MTPRTIATLNAAVLALILAACGGGEESGGATACTPGGGTDYLVEGTEVPYFPITISSDLAIGENRFVLGLIDTDQQPVAGADVNVRLFCFAGGDEKVYRTDIEPEPLTVTRSYTHVHEDGTVETHEAGEIGVYVSNVTFDVPGRWGIEVTGTASGDEIERAESLFEVREEAFTPDNGEPAPLSRQPTLADVRDIAQIDTSLAPIREMHDKTIAEAVASGKPTVIVFATPAFCESLICGPTKSIVDDLYRGYKERANFVHVEPYNVEAVRAGTCQTLFDCRQPVVDEWGLRSEPWVFVVDAQGKIAGKYEGVVSYEELEAALKLLLP